jgi:hypothetical protein
LKAEASTRRKIFLWEITGDVLVVIHASLNAVVRSKNKGRRRCTMTRIEAGIEVIPQLSLEGVFIARVGY